MLEMLKNPGDDFKPLIPKMQELYVSNFDKVYNKMIKFRNANQGSSVSFCGAGAVRPMKYNINMDSVITDAIEMYKSITGNNFIEPSINTQEVKEDE